MQKINTLMLTLALWISEPTRSNWVHKWIVAAVTALSVVLGYVVYLYSQTDPKEAVYLLMLFSVAILSIWAAFDALHERAKQFRRIQTSLGSSLTLQARAEHIQRIRIISGVR